MNNLRTLLFMMLLADALCSSCQGKDSTGKTFHLGGTITATQNGISLIPSFSLGRPAVMFDMNTGGKRLTFEPFFRFGTNGRPWSFIFWWRYKFFTSGRFRISMGAHPSFVFRTVTISNNGQPLVINRADRYAAMDLTPTVAIAKNASVGVYYLYSHGLDETSVQNTHFLTLNASIAQIRLPGKLYAKFNPQVYYLNQDGRDGFYYTHSITLARQRFPISLQSIMNKVIRTDIAGKDLVWNISLIYSFNHNYARRL